ncbi:Uncharacterized protein TPAR_07476 [Tolypocladium paradoxum]|uniref:DASH complex subunit DAD3 n=1 Tax=Tolypocladium paradoxum TaxID=94208 RepID=A0A2S4KQ67_9HYPO|nr:Uncharacterized protein TPAR_07476 [Tolypocladium paradoxum]
MEHSTASSLVSAPELTPLEQQVLDEYERLASNMKQVRPPTPPWRARARETRRRLTMGERKLAAALDGLASNPSTEILDGLRELERKTSLAFTLLKASVYSIVLQQEIDWGGGEGQR